MPAHGEIKLCNYLTTRRRRPAEGNNMILHKIFFSINLMVYSRKKITIVKRSLFTLDVSSQSAQSIFVRQIDLPTSFRTNCSFTSTADEFVEIYEQKFFSLKYVTTNSYDSVQNSYSRFR